MRCLGPRLVLLQGGDVETLRLWQELVDDSKHYYNMIYQRLGITLTDDDLAPESFYNSMLASVCEELQRDGIAVISNGALCAFPPGFTGRDGEPLPLILRKSDGGYGYDTTDLAAIRYRIRDLRADRLIYVVGADQSLHFRMVFAVARQADWLTDEISAEHAAIGLVSDPGGRRLRTRTGESVKLITLIDEAVERAGRVIADRYDDPVLRQSTRLSCMAVNGAQSSYDLRVIKEWIGEAASKHPALPGFYGLKEDELDTPKAHKLYEAASIFRKAGLDPDAVAPSLQLNEGAERALALAVLGLGPAVAGAARGAEPHVLAAFLFGVASTFTTFYEQCPVLGAPSPESRASRLALSALTLRVLITGLGLLGIPVPERM